jgi:hypothetical protein
MCRTISDRTGVLTFPGWSYPHHHPDVRHSFQPDLTFHYILGQRRPSENPFGLLDPTEGGLWLYLRTLSKTTGGLGEVRTAEL